MLAGGEVRTDADGRFRIPLGGAARTFVRRLVLQRQLDATANASADSDTSAGPGEGEVEREVGEDLGSGEVDLGGVIFPS